MGKRKTHVFQVVLSVPARTPTKQVREVFRKILDVGQDEAMVSEDEAPEYVDPARQVANSMRIRRVKHVG